MGAVKTKEIESESNNGENSIDNSSETISSNIARNWALNRLINMQSLGLMTNHLGLNPLNCFGQSNLRLNAIPNLDSFNYGFNSGFQNPLLNSGFQNPLLNNGFCNPGINTVQPGPLSFQNSVLNDLNACGLNIPFSVVKKCENRIIKAVELQNNIIIKFDK